MMASRDLLIEIGTEELPPKALQRMRENACCSAVGFQLLRETRQTSLHFAEILEQTVMLLLVGDEVLEQVLVNWDTMSRWAISHKTKRPCSIRA